MIEEPVLMGHGIQAKPGSRRSRIFAEIAFQYSGIELAE
jgi:hypothetical protein